MLYAFTAALKTLIFPLQKSRTFKIFLLALFYFSITCLCAVTPLDYTLEVMKLPGTEQALSACRHCSWHFDLSEGAFLQYLMWQQRILFAPCPHPVALCQLIVF